jgi:hypothetical protein
MKLRGGIPAAGDDSTIFLCDGSNLPDNQSGNVIRGLDARAYRSYTTPVLMAGGVLNARFEDCSFYGTFGIATLPMGANYTTTIERCTLGGGLAGYHGWKSITRLRDVTFAFNGRQAIHTYGSSLDVRDYFVTSGSNRMEGFAWLQGSDYGGLYEFRNGLVDSEGNAGYTRSVFTCERAAYCPQTTLRIEDMQVSSIGDVPFLDLDDVNDWSLMPPGILVASGLTAYSSPSCLVRSNGPGWTGSVSGSNIVPATLQEVGTYGKSNVTIVPYLPPKPTPTPPPVQSVGTYGPANIQVVPFRPPTPVPPPPPLPPAPTPPVG